MSPIFKRSSPKSSAVTPRNLFTSSSTTKIAPKDSIQKSYLGNCNLSNNNKRSFNTFDDHKDSQIKKVKYADISSTPSSSHQSNVTLACDNHLVTHAFDDVSRIACPPEYDPTVWNSLPSDIKADLISNSSVNPNPDIPDDPLCPPDIDPFVFKELPDDIKNEILVNYKAKVTPKSKSSKNSIKNYFSPK